LISIDIRIYKQSLCEYQFLGFVNHYINIIKSQYCIGGVMVSMLASREVDRGFEPRSGKTKDYKIGIYCFSTVLRRKNEDWLALNQGNVSEWGEMSIRELLFQWASTIKMQLSILVLYKADLIIISLKINLFSPWYSWKIVELLLKNNYSLNKMIYVNNISCLMVVFYLHHHCKGPIYQTFCLFCNVVYIAI
jgi:hypothetical protein